MLRPLSFSIALRYTVKMANETVFKKIKVKSKYTDDILIIKRCFQVSIVLPKFKNRFAEI